MTHKTSTPKLREYRLMYFYGVWITKERFAAETDAEAVFDADAIFSNSSLKNWTYGVALFRGNKRVKTYRPT